MGAFADLLAEAKPHLRASARGADGQRVPREFLVFEYHPFGRDEEAWYCAIREDGYPDFHDMPNAYGRTGEEALRGVVDQLRPKEPA